MPASARADGCLRASWGGGAILGCALFVAALDEVAVLAAVMAGAMLAVLSGLALSRALCLGPGALLRASSRPSGANAATAGRKRDKKNGDGAVMRAATTPQDEGEREMSDARGGLSCAAVCWLTAAAAGLVALIVMLFYGTVGFFVALFMASAIFVALGLTFGFLFCRDLAAPRDGAEGPAPRTAAAPEAPARKPEPAPQSTPVPAPEPAAAAPAAPAVPAAAPEGRKPEGLSAPRDGAPDNLKEIRGIGPKLEKLLNSMGYFHFDQIAAWGPDEVAWIDQNLPGFRGRVSRDDWVGQAGTLAAGGHTEFASRVRDGDVYE